MRHTRKILCAVPALVVLGTVASAQTINTFTITDGGCSYTLTNIIGGRLDPAAGTATMNVGPANHMRQNWFWYRTSSDTREYALSNQIRGSASGNQARLLYLEPISDGQFPDAMLVDLQYTIHDMKGAAPGACHRCELVIAIKVRNLATGIPGYAVELFSYNDMDLNGTPTNDTASISGSNSQIQLIFDPGGPDPTGLNLCPAGGVYKVSSTSHSQWEIGPSPTILAKLTNAVPDVLANAISPFGPGDYSGAQSWRFVLGAPGQFDDEWIGSVVKEIAIHGPGDIDGDCDVDLDDLTLLLQSFGRICP